MSRPATRGKTLLAVGTASAKALPWECMHLMCLRISQEASVAAAGARGTVVGVRDTGPEQGVLVKTMAFARSEAELPWGFQERSTQVV